MDQTGPMISEHLAAALRDAGLRWQPAAGDRFVIPQPELAGELFTLSEMTIEAREYPTGTILGFNGTTEWAMDSVAQEDALWMPREDQLRDKLGGTFVSLSRMPATHGAHAATHGAHAAGDGATGATWSVTTSTPSGDEAVHRASTAADAYALALLALIDRALDGAVL